MVCFPKLTLNNTNKNGIVGVVKEKKSFLVLRTMEWGKGEDLDFNKMAQRGLFKDTLKLRPQGKGVIRVNVAGDRDGTSM